MASGPGPARAGRLEGGEDDNRGLGLRGKGDQNGGERSGRRGYWCVRLRRKVTRGLSWGEDEGG